MSNFNDRLLAAGEQLGLRNARIQHGGGRGCARRFRRHPHIVGEVAGSLLEFPVKGRPKDTPRRWRNYLSKLRRAISQLSGTPQVAKAKPTRRPKPKGKPRLLLKPLFSAPKVRPVQVPPSPHSVDDHPFAVLAELRDRLVKAAAEKTSEMMEQTDDHA